MASRGDSKPLVCIHRGSLIQKPYNEWTWEEACCCGNLIPLLPRAGFLLSSAPGRDSFLSTLLGEERQNWCSLTEVRAHFLSVANCHQKKRDSPNSLTGCGADCASSLLQSEGQLGTWTQRLMSQTTH